MDKNVKKDNALIKRRSLMLKLKNADIKRISSESLDVLDDFLAGELDRIISALKEEMSIQGRKL